MTADAAIPLTHLAGQLLGPFQLVQLIGIGAMGAVYLARDGVLQRDVAIKLIAKGGAETDPERRDRFLREARAAAKLIHPNVVQIFQVGEDDHVRFIAMEYVQGVTTAQAAKQHGGRLPEHFGIEKMREAAAALHLAATHGVTHRDIKPANLLLTTSGALKVADFGLASHAEGGSSLGPAAGTLEGTPFYMSPEQWTGGGVEPPSDVYSLGCTFYHLLVGRTPYAARDLAGCYRAHCQAPIPDPKVAMPDIDPLLAELLKRCMAKRPPERPSAAQIVETLDDMLMLRRSNVRARAITGSLPNVSVTDPTMGSAASFSGRELTPMPSAGRGTPMPPPTVQVGSGGSLSGSSSLAGNNLSGSSSLAGNHLTGSSSLPGGHRISQLGSTTGQYTYRDYFGLTGYPFSDIRLPTSFWDTGPYAWILRTLVSQVAAGQRPAMLVGDPGSGRTFVCEMIRNKFQRIHTFTLEPQLLFGTRIMVSLCRQVGATAVSAGAGQRFLIEAFLTQALARTVPDAMAVVVIDGVDPNDRDLVLELEDILRQAPSRFSMILVGAADLPAALAANGAPYGLYSGAQPLLLPGMTQQEMVDYIDFRMRAVGGATRGLELDIATQQLLHARSGGSPKLVNIYCHNALTIAALTQQRSITLKTLRLGMKSKSYLTPEAATALLAG